MNKALKHPWITRQVKDEIPSTFLDSLSKREKIFEFKSV